MRGYRQAISKYYTILQKGFEHPLILEEGWVSWNQIPTDTKGRLYAILYDLKNNPKSNFPLLLIPVSAIYIVYFTTELLERVIYSGYRHFFTFCLLSSTHIYLASALFLHLITLSFSWVLEITHLVFPIILWSYLISLSHELLVLFLIL